MTSSAALLEVSDLKVHFPIHTGLLRRQTGVFKAVDGVSFTVPAGKTVGLVGESGSGKTTIGRTLVKLIKAGNRAEAHDLFDRHLPLLRYEQQPGMLGLAVRKYILKRRGAIASNAQRKPGIKLSKEAIAEIEFLIARLERNN